MKKYISYVGMANYNLSYANKFGEFYSVFADFLYKRMLVIHLLPILPPVSLFYHIFYLFSDITWRQAQVVERVWVLKIGFSTSCLVLNFYLIKPNNLFLAFVWKYK
jgi:hypothetical protein